MTTRHLYIMRHAKSDWSSEAPGDFERPLATRGAQAAVLMGEWMTQYQVRPERIISSPARRAEQTVHTVAEVLGYDTDRIVWEPRVYDADVKTLLEIVAAWDREPASVMLVGHNPGFEDLVRHLAGDNLGVHDRAKLMPTAALAALGMPDAWNALPAGCAKVEFITRPREIDNG